LLIAAAGLYVGFRLAAGLELESSILALLPRGEQDAARQLAQDRVAASFSRRVVLLVGHRDARGAIEAGRGLAMSLQESGLVSSVTALVDPESQRAMASAYFPFRAGLLALHDRDQLVAGNGAALAQRALAVIFGPGGAADSRLLARDPFL